MPASTSSRPAAHIPSLDGLRAVAIAIVFASHAGVSHLIPGGFGVTLFFFLSGFLITTLMERECADTGSIAIGRFYVRRLLRLMPALLFVLALGLLLVALGLTTGALATDTFLSQLLFFYNYHSLTPDFSNSVEGFSVFWSLSVEEHFYLLWPALFLMLRHSPRRILWVCGLLALFLIWRWIRLSLLQSSEWAIYISSDTRMDAILYGCLLAFLMQGGQLARLFHSGWRMYLWLGGAVFLLLATFALRDPIFRSTLRYSLQGLALIPVFYYAVSQPTHSLFRLLNHKLLRKIGVWSYALYLLHFMVINALTHLGIATLGSWQMVLISATLSLALAAAIHRFVERPMMPLRHRFAPQQAQQTITPKQPHAAPETGSSP